MQYYYLLESEPEMSNIEFSTSMYPVAPPFDIVYKHEATDHPVGPHSHNAAELYYTLTDLPDVLLNDKVLEVKAGTLLARSVGYISKDQLNQFIDEALNK